MKTVDFETLMTKVNLESKPLPGYVSFQKKDSGIYGIWFKDYHASDKDGSTRYHPVYLGKTIDQEKAIFFRPSIGRFSFDVKKGFVKLGYPGSVPATDGPAYPVSRALHFGDIWMIDQVYKRSGLDKVMETLVPDEADTLKSLVAFRLIKNEAYYLVKDWYERSFACVLYPKADFESARISEFHSILGREENYTKFFNTYLDIVINKDKFSNNISIPILIDSFGLENSIKNYLTDVNNHNRDISNEIRLIYVIDKDTKMPIYFRAVSGNIIDSSTLINTINNLKAHNINVNHVIMDAGYPSINNLEQLMQNNIPFITRMPSNRKEYKDLMQKHGNNLISGVNSTAYGERAIYVIKDTINLGNSELYAYVMLDLEQYYKEVREAALKYKDDADKSIKIDKVERKAGRFILLSTKDHNCDEILPIYYTKQFIEQFFDILKTDVGVLPLRGHSEKTIRGLLLIAFISSAVYTYLEKELTGLKFSAHLALIKMGNAIIKIYSDTELLEELTKDQK
ncbi:MAG: transposase, partial [Deltaproteobacteria bacterium]|nr:transposase [Deltaproteobacteria bacterium]